MEFKALSMVTWSPGGGQSVVKCPRCIYRSITVYFHQWTECWDRMHPQEVCRWYKIRRSSWYTTDCCAAGQRDLSRLQQWADKRLKEFNKGKSKVCYPHGEIAPCTSTGWGPSDWKGILRVIFWGHGEKQADNKLRMHPWVKKGQQPSGAH